ncbi:MAG TPA: 3-dehydroquinate synthase [Candidatus Eisenbacteria bacterium]
MSPDFTIRTRGALRDCRVLIQPGSLARAGPFARSLSRGSRAAVVSDTRVAALYARDLLRSLARAGFRPSLVALPRGERAKRPAMLFRLWERFAALGLARGDLVVALGGGVIGDLAGFAAATWLRGVGWMGVPTTLLAQVDSSVGGKTAIDLRAGKNLAGAFHPPAGVLVDPLTLRSLPARERRAGLAEVVKTGMAVDAALFRWVEREAWGLAAGDPEALAGAVARTLAAKARIVRRDERDRGPRLALNYGHTLAHALEAAGGYRGLLHGEAVAIGMRVAAALSVRAAGLPEAARARQDALLDRFGLTHRVPGTRLARLFDGMARDKKRSDAGVRWVLTPRVGHASLPRLISRRLVQAAMLEAGARE